MHTEVLENTVDRELTRCIHVVEQTRLSLSKWQRKYGMEFEQAVIAAGENRLYIPDSELAQWQDDVATLPQWEQRLQQYRVASTAAS
nr:hypothetical protein [uncultured Desulfobulbus sp.]